MSVFSPSLQRLEAPLDLPTEDGEPLETHQHRIAMNALIQSLKQAWSNRTDYFVGGNMFVYFSPDQELTKDYRGPDFFVVLNTTAQNRRALARHLGRSSGTRCWGLATLLRFAGSIASLTRKTSTT